MDKSGRVKLFLKCLCCISTFNTTNIKTFLLKTNYFQIVMNIIFIFNRFIVYL